LRARIKLPAILSCVLLRNGISSFDELLEYLRFARVIRADNVVFRQLMGNDPIRRLSNAVVRCFGRNRPPSPLFLAAFLASTRGRPDNLPGREFGITGAPSSLSLGSVSETLVQSSTSRPI